METTSIQSETLLDFGEEGEGLDRRHGVDVHASQVVERGLVLSREQRELAAGGGIRVLGAREAGPPLAVELRPLEVAQDLLGAQDDRGWEAGQPGDLDAERAVRAAGLDLPQEH